MNNDHRWAEAVCARGEASRVAAEEEHGPGRTRKAYRLVPGYAVKLERGKLFPTLPTLLRIAMVFSVGLDYFFTDERKRRVVAIVRKQDRIR